jgi:hypothetical protein
MDIWVTSNPLGLSLLEVITLNYSLGFSLRKYATAKENKNQLQIGIYNLLLNNFSPLTGWVL